MADAALDAAGFAALMARLGPFEARPRLAVAVSGGADSMALALLAAGWASEVGGEAVALTVDHRLRPDSTAEARRVGRWLAARGIRHHVLAWTGPRPDADIQAAARGARYRLLARWCAKHDVLHLLLAHHRDDQAETLLLRLGRGSGLDGLAAMAPVAEAALPTTEGPIGIRLLRPFLELPKSVLEATLRQHGQDWVRDPSNMSDAYGRVRMRRLMPLLAEEGLSAERLAATAAHLARARAALDAAVARLAAEAVMLHPAGFARLLLGPYRSAPAETALRCLARALATVGGLDYPPRFDRLERLHRSLMGAERDGRRARTLGGCRVEIGPEAALICRELADATEELALAPGRTVWWDRRFLVRAGPRPRGAEGPLRLVALGQEGWREALRMQPELRGAKLPLAARLALPAVRDEAGLLEVPHLGFRRSGSAGPAVARVEFAPRNPLAPACFMVV